MVWPHAGPDPLGWLFRLQFPLSSLLLNSLVCLQVKGIYLYTELFSVENGLLTPTMKAKRPELRNYFRSQIDELYSTIKV